jgi:hypothetical protein
LSVCHHREDVDMPEYLARLSSYEDFLAEYVLPYRKISIQRLIDC